MSQRQATPFAERSSTPRETSVEEDLAALRASVDADLAALRGGQYEPPKPPSNDPRQRAVDAVDSANAAKTDAGSRGVSGVLRGLGITGIPDVVETVLSQGPITTATDMVKGTFAPLGRLGNVGDAFRKAGVTGALNEVAASIPILGPAAEHASQQSKAGNQAGAAGEVLGLVGGATVLPGAMKAGLTRAAPPVIRTAEGLMQSALKPGVARMRDVVRGRMSVPPVVQTMLKNGISVSDSGLGKVNRLLKSDNNTLRQIISESDATTNASAIADRAATSRRGLENQATPLSDLRAFDDAIDEFVQVHGGTGIIKGGKPMSMSRTQELKTGTYDNLESKDFGTVQHGAKEGQKAIARGMKEEIEAGIPSSDVRGINRTIGENMEAREALGYRLGVSKNRDPGGITPIAPTDLKFFAMLMMRHPGVKSMLARGLYRSASIATKVPESVLRSAWVGMLQSEDQEGQ